MLKRVHHLAVLVRDLDRAMALYRDTFGLRLIRRMLFVERNVDVVLFDLGGVILEVMQPVGPGRPQAWLEQHGEGFFHIAFVVDNLPARLRELEAQGVGLLDREPRPGIGWLVAWLDRESTFGLQAQLVGDGEAFDPVR